MNMLLILVRGRKRRTYPLSLDRKKFFMALVVKSSGVMITSKQS